VARGPSTVVRGSWSATTASTNFITFAPIQKQETVEAMTQANPYSDFHIQLLQEQLKLNPKSIRSTLRLLNEGATIPFISRYRKEATGSLDEVQISEIDQAWKKLQEIEKRKETILSAIEEQGKLTPELEARIRETYDSATLEDLYLPYKRKRKTRASVAREKGLEPLATFIFAQPDKNPEEEAKKFLREEVPDIEEALQGARDIIAEWINEDKKARDKVRYAYRKGALIRSKVARGKEEEGKKFKDYFDYEEPLAKCPSHRLLAMRRGEEEGFLRLSIAPEPEETLYSLERLFLKGQNANSRQVKTALEDAYDRLLQPSIETEFRNLSKEKADEEAIKVFADNLRQLLLSPPLGQKWVLALDPGYRTGCKIVCLDDSGKLLANATIFPHPPQNDQSTAAKTVKHLVETWDIEAIAVGNGTASRETMTFVQGIDFGRPVEVFLVNENGASIYSASELAREEFPDQDVTVRGAVSIGRRLMDPLAELVKIDPKSIGVGQYQHDVNQPRLKDQLDQVVSSCVNAVGVNLNTASKHLLTYISGLGPVLADNIVHYRDENGLFQSRKQLLKVARMGPKAFEQSAGFLRIRDGKNPLDNTAVHPERYKLVEQMAADQGCSVEELIRNPEKRRQIKLSNYVSETVGMPTLKDILQELEKPGLDPRGKAQPFEFAKGLRTIDDLQSGMVIPGIVTNVTKFGAFVDIGIKESGLIHISQLANRFVKDPLEIVSLGQKLNVKVIDIDRSRGRIQLSLKEV
jgi:uncharacterized protein